MPNQFHFRAPDPPLLSSPSLLGVVPPLDALHDQAGPGRGYEHPLLPIGPHHAGQHELDRRGRQSSGIHLPQPLADQRIRDRSILAKHIEGPVGPLVRGARILADRPGHELNGFFGETVSDRMRSPRWLQLVACHTRCPSCILAVHTAHLIRSKLRTRQIYNSWGTIKVRLNHQRRVTTLLPQNKTHGILLKQDARLTPFARNVFKAMGIRLGRNVQKIKTKRPLEKDEEM
ncbi:MAG: hypothetical protein F4X29_09325 [Rhodothermaceae bacterium]|nr:hypothetical protein [Rhodothermaceae bacterium]